MSTQTVHHRALEMEVFIPEDHRLTVDLPETFQSGRAILVVTPLIEEAVATKSGRLAQFVRDLTREDPRPFSELSRDERRARLRRGRGIGRGMTSGSDGLAQSRREEVALEERKFHV